MLKKMKSKIALFFYSFVGLYFTAASAYAAPNSEGVNKEAAAVSKFIIDILGGPTGYMLTLVAFLGGIFLFIQKRDFWAALGCFAIALAILIVPAALQGFFTNPMPTTT